MKGREGRRRAEGGRDESSGWVSAAFLAEWRGSVVGWPYRIDFSRAGLALMATGARPTSMSYLPSVRDGHFLRAFRGVLGSGNCATTCGTIATRPVAATRDCAHS